MSLCVTARFYVVGHLSLVIPLPPPSISSCESTTGRREGRRAKRRPLAQLQNLFRPLPTVGLCLTLLRSTQAACPPPSPPSFSSGAFHAQLLPGEKRRGTRRGDRRRRSFLRPCFLPPLQIIGENCLCAPSPPPPPPPPLCAAMRLRRQTPPKASKCRARRITTSREEGR